MYTAVLPVGTTVYSRLARPTASFFAIMRFLRRFRLNSKEDILREHVKVRHRFANGGTETSLFRVHLKFYIYYENHFSNKYHFLYFSSKTPRVFVILGIIYKILD